MTVPFFEPGRNCWTVEEAAYAGAHIDTRSYYRAFAQAALRAERQIFLAGWQFDSSTELLRGDDARGFPAPTSFLPFLNSLCARRPDLEIHVLAWDFSVVFGLDREWNQDRMFNWRGHPRLHFAYDSKHPVGACQHQKIVVIDGHWAFLGGMDICNSRWDVPGHGPVGGLRRNADGRPYPPKHDVQAALEGAPAAALGEWFVRQWRMATSLPIEDVIVVPKKRRPFASDVEFGAGPVALSQTRGRTVLPPRRAVKQVQALLVDAIARAEKSIYMENQYFTAKAVVDALMKRMRDKKRGPIEVAILMPKERTAIEFYSISGAETRLISLARRIAAVHGHRFAAYHPFTADENGQRSVWMHSKLLMVDDTFLTIGSANFDNRSMGFDTEVNAAWIAEPDSPRSAKIALLRRRLLGEHVAASPENPALNVGPVTAIERLGLRSGRILPYTPPKMNRLVANFRSDRTILDPARPTMEDRLAEFMKDAPNSPIQRGLSSLLEWMSLRPRRARQRQEAEARRERERAAPGR